MVECLKKSCMKTLIINLIKLTSQLKIIRKTNFMMEEYAQVKV